MILKNSLILMSLLVVSIILISLPYETIASNDHREKIKAYKELFSFKNNQYECTDCWCLPEDGPDGTCPPLQDRKLHYTKKHRIQFQSFNLSLTPYGAQPHLYPQGESPDPNNDKPVCTPYPDLQKTLKLPTCEEPKDYGDDAVCAFFYEEDGCVNRNYGMKTYSSWDDAENDNSIVTHLGACGVCSNAKDLAVNLRPDLTDKSYACGFLYWDSNLCYRCYLNLGFTPDCAWVWTTNTIHTSTYCKKICIKDVGEPVNDPITCELNNCFMCDEVKSGPNFELYGGRTRRGSGIITDIVRECDDIANILQDPCVAGGSAEKVIAI